VRGGETIASIAKKHRVSVSALLKANGVRNPRTLQVGRVLRLPASVARRAKRPIVVATRPGSSRVLD
jgi:LysM repeat protein